MTLTKRRKKGDPMIGQSGFSRNKNKQALQSKKASPEYQLAKDMENEKRTNSNSPRRKANNELNPNKIEAEKELQAREQERLNAEQNVAQVKSSNQQDEHVTQGASIEVIQSKNKNKSDKKFQPKVSKENLAEEA